MATVSIIHLFFCKCIYPSIWKAWCIHSVSIHRCILIYIYSIKKSQNIKSIGQSIFLQKYYLSIYLNKCVYLSANVSIYPWSISANVSISSTTLQKHPSANLSTFYKSIYPFNYLQKIHSSVKVSLSIVNKMIFKVFLTTIYHLNLPFDTVHLI